MAITQQQIAELTGVPRSTVARILNNYPNVNPETAMRVRKIAHDLGYVPNRAGSLLQRAKRPIRLGVVLQSTQTPFMQNVVREIGLAQDLAHENGAELIVHEVKSMDAELQLEKLALLAEDRIDGLMLTPIADDRVCKAINAFADRGIPVVTFNTDMPASKRLCYVGQDNYLSGRTCAGLMNLLLCGQGTVLMVAGHYSIQGQRERISGFYDEVKLKYRKISILPTEFCREDYELAYDIVAKHLRENPKITGIYFSSDGPVGACRAIEDAGKKGNVHLVCHDTTIDNTTKMLDGYIDFIIDQNARLQATKPVSVLLDYILSNRRPEKELLLTHIDIRSEYNIFSEAML